MPEVKSLKPGDALPDLVKAPIAKVQLVQYAGASGDYNLIHVDSETARAVGLPSVIAHGMLSMGMLGEFAATVAGPANVRRLAVRFGSMVFPGDVLTCKGVVKAVADGVLTAECWAENQKGEKVTYGELEVAL